VIMWVKDRKRVSGKKKSEKNTKGVRKKGKRERVRIHTCTYIRIYVHIFTYMSI